MEDVLVYRATPRKELFFSTLCHAMMYFKMSCLEIGCLGTGCESLMSTNGMTDFHQSLIISKLASCFTDHYLSFLEGRHPIVNITAFSWALFPSVQTQRDSERLCVVCCDRRISLYCITSIAFHQYLAEHIDLWWYHFSVIADVTSCYDYYMYTQ